MMRRAFEELADSRTKICIGTDMDSKLKITVLYESWGEEEETAPEPEKKKRGTKKRRKKREKHDREEIFEALEKLGHEPSYMVLDGEDKSLTGAGPPGN